ncbi:MAG: hypothetical protein RL318_2891 [Fibrobacterota bacterium]|jgi:hypothetical protein
MNFSSEIGFQNVLQALRPAPGPRGCRAPWESARGGSTPCTPTKGSPAVHRSAMATLRYPLAKAMRLRRGTHRSKRENSQRTTPGFKGAAQRAWPPKQCNAPRIFTPIFPFSAARHGAPCCDPDRVGQAKAGSPPRPGPRVVRTRTLLRNSGDPRGWQSPGGGCRGRQRLLPGVWGRRSQAWAARRALLKMS